jgi:hypothetical protein
MEMSTLFSLAKSGIGGVEKKHKTPLLYALFDGSHVFHILNLLVREREKGRERWGGGESEYYSTF